MRLTIFAKEGQALCVEFRFCGSWISEVPANIPPRWIKTAQKSRKRIEPEIVEALHSMISMRRNRPRAQVALKKANHEFKGVLSRRNTEILLELQRNGSSKL